MPFGRLHEEAAGEDKLLILSDAAWRMWGMGLIYCQKNLTDGFIAGPAIELWGVKAKDKRRVADELCREQVKGRAPLWARVDGGYEVHDYLQWNDSKEEILKARAGAKDRIARFRDRERQEREELERRVRDAEQNATQNTERNALLNGEQHAHDVVRGSGDLKEEKGDPRFSAVVPDESSAPERVLDSFRANWKRAYGFECSLILKPLELMQLDQHVTAIPESRLLAAINAYFATTDEYVRKAKHPLPLFLRDPLRHLAKSAAVGSTRPSGCKHEPACADDAAHTKRKIADSKALAS